MSFLSVLWALSAAPATLAWAGGNNVSQVPISISPVPVVQTVAPLSNFQVPAAPLIQNPGSGAAMALPASSIQREASVLEPLVSAPERSRLEPSLFKPVALEQLRQINMAAPPKQDLSLDREARLFSRKFDKADDKAPGGSGSPGGDEPPWGGGGHAWRRVAATREEFISVLRKKGASDFLLPILVLHMVDQVLIDGYSETETVLAAQKALRNVDIVGGDTFKLARSETLQPYYGEFERIGEDQRQALSWLRGRTKVLAMQQRINDELGGNLGYDQRLTRLWLAHRFQAIDERRLDAAQAVAQLRALVPLYAQAVSLLKSFTVHRDVQDSEVKIFLQRMLQVNGADEEYRLQAVCALAADGRFDQMIFWSGAEQNTTETMVRVKAREIADLALNPLDAFEESKVGIAGRFISVEPGTFLMGSPAGEGYGDEYPQHSVTVSKGYDLQATPMTDWQFLLIMGYNPSRFRGRGRDDHPVENISWEDAHRAFERYNALQDRWTLRLPTEAEWEKAAKDGEAKVSRSMLGFMRGNAVDDEGWHFGNSKGSTQPVAKKKPNALGLYDMKGNVWEWVEDWHGAYTAGSVVDPTGSDAGSYRVVRGGSWYNYARYLRAAYRIFGPGFRYVALGVRAARSRR